MDETLPARVRRGKRMRRPKGSAPAAKGKKHDSTQLTAARRHLIKWARAQVPSSYWLDELIHSRTVWPIRSHTPMVECEASSEPPSRSYPFYYVTHEIRSKSLFEVHGRRDGKPAAIRVQARTRREALRAARKRGIAPDAWRIIKWIPPKRICEDCHSALLLARETARLRSDSSPSGKAIQALGEQVVRERDAHPAGVELAERDLLPESAEALQREIETGVLAPEERAEYDQRMRGED